MPDHVLKLRPNSRALAMDVSPEVDVRTNAKTPKRRSRPKAVSARRKEHLHGAIE
jgi:hypothetical protein